MILSGTLEQQWIQRHMQWIAASKMQAINYTTNAYSCACYPMIRLCFTDTEDQSKDHKSYSQWRPYPCGNACDVQIENYKIKADWTSECVVHVWITEQKALPNVLVLVAYRSRHQLKLHTKQMKTVCMWSGIESSLFSSYFPTIHPKIIVQLFSNKRSNKEIWYKRL